MTIDFGSDGFRGGGNRSGYETVSSGSSGELVKGGLRGGRCFRGGAKTFPNGDLRSGGFGGGDCAGG